MQLRLLQVMGVVVVAAAEGEAEGPLRPHLLQQPEVQLVLLADQAALMRRIQDLRNNSSQGNVAESAEGTE